ncbi:hypothetical protein BZG02_16585 [Labilibaculum filiforme]|uniref:Uncharacterized protein n=1 Tax=Labilibaculum filiforme TaxID=1940526 RepID=A0A2N3HT74_9BACT|nr:hypothetical protein [Labilibaculum filiforme]PKQ61249.1 hypothetical protein BZG02_16585 [Labilibaculum filiforme]
MLTRLLLTLFFIHLIVACSHQDKLVLPNKLEKQYPLKFETKSEINTNGIFINSGLWANATGDTLLYYAQIQNNRNSSIIISPYLLQIQTQENYRSSPISEKTKTELLPNCTKTFVYKFVPINNKYLFTRTEKRGDLDSCYFIHLNFIQDLNNHSITNRTIKFNANAELFSNYHNNFANEHSINLYELRKENHNTEEIQLNYLKKLQNKPFTKHAVIKDNPHSNLQFSETEIVIDGIVLSTKFYHFNDSLFLNLKLINHSNNYLNFSPDSIQIISSDSVYGQITKHQVVNAVTKTEGYKSIIKKGDRLQTQINFGYFKHPPLEIKVDFTTLKLHPQEIKVFTFNPTFEKSEKLF